MEAVPFPSFLSPLPSLKWKGYEKGFIGGNLSSMFIRKWRNLGAHSMRPVKLFGEV